MGDKQGHLEGLFIEDIRAFKRFRQPFLVIGQTEIKKKPINYKNKLSDGTTQTLE